MKNSKFDEQWLLDAIKIEDEVGCDIQAGLELGQNLSKYLETAKNSLDHQKLISIIKERYDDVLSEKDIEDIADKIQEVAQGTVKKKLIEKKTA